MMLISNLTPTVVDIERQFLSIFIPRDRKLDNHRETRSVLNSVFISLL